MTRDERMHAKAVLTVASFGTFVSVAFLLVGANQEAFIGAAASFIYLMVRGSSKPEA